MRVQMENVMLLGACGQIATDHPVIQVAVINVRRVIGKVRFCCLLCRIERLYAGGDVDDHGRIAHSP